MIELYIDGRKADLTTDISVPMNYELEKLANPTTIKNNFSKTIQLQATPTNNQIFGYYYELDKVVNGGYNAIQRIPFHLYSKGEIIESGYIQLNNIKYINNNYVYEITLYGGLGDFFYNLAYDDEGNDKSLADLNYGFGENDEDFKFTMDADTVNRAWNNTSLPANRTLLGGVISFIPSYNGIYEDFSNDKVLINTNNTSIFPSEMEDADYTTFTTINGYGNIELGRELTEWQIRDLRCYKQRPALRLQSFIQTICKPENNGGYEVELDEANFFNRDNSYYRDSWIALPLLNPDSEDFPSVTTTTTATTTNNTQIAIDGTITTIPITVCGQTTTTPNLASEYANSTIDVDFDFSLMVNNQTTNSNILMTSKYVEDDRGRTQAGYGGIGVWLELKVDGQVIGVSDSYVFTKGLYKATYKGNRNKLLSKVYTVPTIDDFDGYFNGVINSNFYYFDGDFRRIGSTNNFLYSDVNNNNTFKLSLKNIPIYENMEITINTQMFCSKLLFEPDEVFDNLLYRPAVLYTPDGINVSGNNITFSDIQLNSIVKLNTNKKTLQGVEITKKQLLKNKITPASLLTSFTKLFGLYFVKDAAQKKIKICSRNSFFENAEIIDIDDKVDYSSEVKIDPVLFNKKWYLLTSPALETTQMETYKGDYYEAEYGQKRINTNYNFNTDIEDIYKDNQYQNVITMLDSSKYYRNFVDKNGENAPTFVIDEFKYKLWEKSDINNSFEKSFKKTDILDNSTPIHFSTLVGVDAMPKICCFDLDNDKQSLNDLNVSLVIFNGLQYLKDIEGNNIYYTISNDIPLMLSLNDGTPMYLFSNSEEDVNGNKICIRTNALPQFTRYNIVYGNVVDSLDFGLPLETYINDNYTEDSTLYNSFWQKFYQDQFSENTRKVTAYVKFDDLFLGNHSLSNFYYFNKCYWLLNKIIDYDLANPYKKVKCEFIKINNLSNYTNGQKAYIPLFEVSVDWDNLEDYRVVEGIEGVRYGNNWIAKFTAYGLSRLYVSMDGVPQSEIENHYTLANSGTNYTLTVTNITGDVGIDIVGADPSIFKLRNYIIEENDAYVTLAVNNKEVEGLALNSRRGKTSGYTTEEIESIDLYLDSLDVDSVYGNYNLKTYDGYETSQTFILNNYEPFEIPTNGRVISELTINFITLTDYSENACELEMVNNITDEIRDTEISLYVNLDRKLFVTLDAEMTTATTINSYGIYDVYIDFVSRDISEVMGTYNIIYWDGTIVTRDFSMNVDYTNFPLIDENVSAVRKIQIFVDDFENY